MPPLVASFYKSAVAELEIMARTPSTTSPFLFGFDELERTLDPVVKGADGYPSYNIERYDRTDSQPERLRIALAVPGFARDQLDVTIEENQLVIQGRQRDDKTAQIIHRGIAARHFQRTFVLAEGMQVLGADLKDGILCVDLARPGRTLAREIIVSGSEDGLVHPEPAPAAEQEGEDPKGQRTTASSSIEGVMPNAHEIDWDEVPAEVIKRLLAELDSPESHLAYLRARLQPVFEHAASKA